MHQTFITSSLSSQPDKLNKENQAQKTVFQEVEVFSVRSLKPENLVCSIQQLPNELLFNILKKLGNYRNLQSFRCTSKAMKRVSIEFEKSKVENIRRSKLTKIQPNVYENNYVYYEYKQDKNGVSQIGVTLKDGYEYKTDATKIHSVYSCLEKKSKRKHHLRLVGILNDNKSKFYLDGEFPTCEGKDLNDLKSTFNYSVHMQLSGILKVSPDWRRLFNEMQILELCDITLGICDQHYIFSHWIKSSFNEERWREKLITVFQNTDSESSTIDTIPITTEMAPIAHRGDICHQTPEISSNVYDRDLHSSKFTYEAMQKNSIKFDKSESYNIHQSILKIIQPNIYESNCVYYEYKQGRKGLLRIGVILEDDSEYKTDSKKILFVYSYLEKQINNKNQLQMVGILNDKNKSKFYLDGEFPILDGQYLDSVKTTFNFSCDMEFYGILKVSPDWKRLFNEMQASELYDISMGIKFVGLYYLSNQCIKSVFDEKCLREKLITLFQNTYSIVSTLYAKPVTTATARTTHQEGLD